MNKEILEKSFQNFLPMNVFYGRKYEQLQWTFPTPVITLRPGTVKQFGKTFK